MYLQRARINCRRCYELANSCESQAERFGNDSLYASRNETLRCVEREFNEYIEGVSEKNILLTLLNECERCDYHEPRIIELTKNFGGR